VEAVNLANRLLSQIWVNADRSNETTLQTSLNAFQHQAGGATCDFNGGAATSAVATAWLAMVQQPLLPGGNDAKFQQIRVDQEVVPGASVTSNIYRVTITLCWIAPNEPAGSTPHRHTVVAYVS
jgi:hypothetical protein